MAIVKLIQIFWQCGIQLPLNPAMRVESTHQENIIKQIGKLMMVGRHNRKNVVRKIAKWWN